MRKLKTKHKLLVVIIAILLFLNVSNLFDTDSTIDTIKQSENSQNNLKHGEIAEIFILNPEDQVIKRDIFVPKKKVLIVHAKPAKRIPIKKKRAPSQREVLVKTIKAELGKFKLAGIARKKDILYAFIIFEDDTHEARVGDILYKKFKVTLVTEKEIELIHMPTKIKEKIKLGK